MSTSSTDSDYDNESVEPVPPPALPRAGSAHKNEHELLTLSTTVQTAIAQYMSYVHGRM